MLSLAALAELDAGWTVGASVVFVVFVQGASGVVKELTKTGAKSAVERLARADVPRGALFG